MTYLANGNINWKSDIGQYTYGGPRPHAVTQAGNYVLNGYDANGNLTQYTAPGGSVTTIGYTSFNMLVSLTTSNGNSLNYLYNGEHQRIREMRTLGGVQTTLYTMHPDNQGGLFFEKEISGSQTTFKHYVSGGTGVAAVVMYDTTWHTDYWHKDHLGSVVAITNDAGTVTSRKQFDPWGLAAGTAQNGYRGFTGHEQFDALGIVNMNGRTYLAALGRFMSADPVLQDPHNLQNYDRYGYCYNNPVICTDPSGYKFWKKKWFRAIAAVAVAYFTAGSVNAWMMNSAWQAAGNVMTAEAFFAAKAMAGIASGAAGGFAGALVGSGGNLEAALKGAVTGGLFGWAGSVSPLDPGGFERLAAHAGAGCVGGMLDGGGCGRGAASAVVGKMITNATDGWRAEAQFAAATIAGGTASAIGGGKFANGAITAAFGYLFNQAMTRTREQNSIFFSSHEERELRAFQKALSADLREFGDRLKELHPEEYSRFENWKVSISLSRSQSGHPADTNYGTQTTTFFRQHFVRDDRPERLDTIAHEFRHLMPANNRLPYSPMRDSPGEEDARKWARDFWRPRNKP